jgi:hypothetical protein
MKRLLPLLLACGCGGALVRIPSARPTDGAPRIDRLVDLGALPLGEAGELDLTNHDERFTPSEWVAVVGSGLHGAALSLDGAALPIGGYLEGGSVLVRLPAELTPAKHTLLAKTADGASEASFDSLTYVIGSDTDGNSIRFLRIGAAGKDRVDDPELSVAQKGTLYHAFSPDGSILYSLGLSAKKQEGKSISFVTELALIHLGAANKPQSIGSTSFTMSSHPSGIAITRDGLMLILGTHELVLFTLEDPRSPQQIGALSLSSDPQDRFLEMALLREGRAVALLEVTDNRTVVVSLEDPKQPRAIAELDLGPAKDAPFSVDLSADPTDPNAFFVLQGLNLRLGGKKIEEGQGAIAGLIGMAERKEEKPAYELPKKGRLVGVRLGEGVLEKTSELPLPDEFLPLFCVPSPDGRFYVSGVSPGALETSSFEAAATSLLGFVKDTVQLGKIASIDRSGGSSIAVQGVAVFFDVDLLPNGELIYSGMRITGKVLPPFVAVKWGVGVGRSGFYGLHEVDYGYVVPPYTYGQVSVQRGAR